MDPVLGNSFINSIVLVIVSVVLTGIVTAVLSHINHKKRADALRDAKIIELEKQLALIAASVVPISTAFQAILIKELTHMHTPVLDALLAKVGPPSSLTEDETEEMAQLLKERALDMGDQISSSERDAAIMLPMVIKRAKIELDEPLVAIKSGVFLQLLSNGRWISHGWSV